MQTLPVWIFPTKDSPCKPQFNLLNLFVAFILLAAGFFTFSITTTQLFSKEVLSPIPVLPCPDEPKGLVLWNSSLLPLKHDMTDEDLFRSASMIPQVREYQCKKVQKVAFMFLTKGPLPLAPLWERFFRGHYGKYTLYIHSVPGYNEEFDNSSVFYQRQIPSQPTEWGAISLCQAERRLLANALLDPSNERFILLSESCIPLHNFTIIYDYLMRSQYSYVEAFDDPGPQGRGRYDPRMEPEISLSQWRKGAQWFEVNREVAVSIVTDTKYYSKFDQFGKIMSDEHYIPTMLSIESPHLIANRTVTWVDWSKGGAHPATFGKNDVTEAFLHKILDEQSCLYNGEHSSVCFLFARKFAPSALDSLLQFSPNVLGFG